MISDYKKMIWVQKKPESRKIWECFYGFHKSLIAQKFISDLESTVLELARYLNITNSQY